MCVVTTQKVVFEYGGESHGDPAQDSRGDSRWEDPGQQKGWQAGGHPRHLLATLRPCDLRRPGSLPGRAVFLLVAPRHRSCRVGILKSCVCPSALYLLSLPPRRGPSAVSSQNSLSPFGPVVVPHPVVSTGASSVPFSDLLLLSRCLSIAGLP